MHVVFQWLKEPTESPFESDGWKSCTKRDGAQTKQAGKVGSSPQGRRRLAYLQLQMQALKLSITESATTKNVFAEGYPDPQAITDWSVPVGT